MKIKIPLIVLWMAMCLPGYGQLRITVNNIHPLEGEIYVAIYDHPEQYMDEEAAVFRKIVPAESESETIVFTAVPDGKYAVAIFQDLNGNGMLDLKLAGIPKEPFGFSNDARGKTGPPKFDQASFDFADEMDINIKLVNNAKN
ncbi:MAG TPA: DUF2141 domain-containing protein [Bacteroidales bacterium]|nr:DUF2141 domain-containing protein [Bacteroidales bacterium]